MFEFVCCDFRNAGFDPALFRVDTYGNVLYLHADSASPLAWDIDHWFPCSSIALTNQVLVPCAPPWNESLRKLV